MNMPRLEQLKQELIKLYSLDHPNLNRCYDTYVNGDKIYIVMEACKGSELFGLLATDGTFSEKKAAREMHKCLLAVRHLHQSGICHRDLKLEKIVISDKQPEEVKIIDFGISANYGKASLPMIASAERSPYFLAPEALMGSYDERGDVWSLGIILFVMLSGYPPFTGNTSIEIVKNIRRTGVHFDQEPW